MKFSVVCPIKNETDLLPITLPSFYALEPSEIILCLDKPAPKELVRAINQITKLLDASAITKIIEIEHDSEYNWQQAYIRRRGFLEASNDIILTCDIDLVLDSRIKNYLDLIDKDVRLISFNKIAYPPTIRSTIANLIQIFYRHLSFSGLYAFSKTAWLETEDMEHLKTQITRAEDTHLHHYLTKRYDYRFIGGLKNYVVRPKESRQYQYMQGVNRWLIRRMPLWRILLSCIVYARPHLLVGYLHARRGLVIGEKVKG